MTLVFGEEPALVLGDRLFAPALSSPMTQTVALSPTLRLLLFLL